jgi:hypothetical protein
MRSFREHALFLEATFFHLDTKGPKDLGGLNDDDDGGLTIGSE